MCTRTIIYWDEVENESGKWVKNGLSLYLNATPHITSKLCVCSEVFIGEKSFLFCH